MNASCSPDRNSAPPAGVAVRSLMALLLVASMATSQVPWQQRVRRHVVVPQPVSTYSSSAFVDLDGDGDLDLAGSRLGSGAVVLLANDGRGRFTPWIPSATFATIGSTIAVGDLDGDGDADLVTRDGYLENIGAGGPVWRPFPFGTTYVCADFNGDGRSDVVTLLGIWQSLGGGAFAAWPGTYAQSGTQAVAAADLDRDGDLDLVFGCSSADVVWRNDGGGTFVDVSATWLPGDTLGWTGGRLVADLDGDGAPDLGRIRSSTLELRRNNGSGVLQPWRSLIDTEDNKLPVDLDGDGDVDLVGAYSWWRNDGAGSFAQVRSYATRYFGGAMAVGDVNGDGRPDLFDGSHLRLFLNAWPRPLVDAGRSAGGFEGYFCAGDFDGDGAPDLLDQQGVVHRNDAGDWTERLESTPNPFVGSNMLPLGGECVDIDGDGDLDVVGVGVQAAGVAFVLQNHGNGTFPPAVLFGSNVDAARPFDADGDGDVDVLLNGMQLWRNDGSGVLVADPFVPVGGATIRVLGVGDFDRDGDLDVLGGDTRLHMFVNDGTGQFTWTPTRLGVIQGQTRIGGVFVADYDGDDHLDAFAWQDGSVGPFGWLLKNLGNGTLVATSGRLPLLIQSPRGNASGDVDVDGDGDIDLVANGHLWTNYGTGTFVDLNAGSGLLLSFQPILIDLDRDGDLDLASSALLFHRRWHAEAPYLPMAGADYRLEFGGTAVAGGLALPFVGLPAHVPLPPYGTIGIDLATAIPLSFTAIDGAGVGRVSVPIPALPALVGIRFCAQAVLVAGGAYHLSPAICDTVL